MYVCMYVFIYYICLSKYSYMYVCMDIYLCVCMYVNSKYKCICMHVCMYVCMYVTMYVCVCICMWVYRRYPSVVISKNLVVHLSDLPRCMYVSAPILARAALLRVPQYVTST